MYAGKPWVPKTKVVDPILDDVTLEPELEEALSNASDAELCDIAGTIQTTTQATDETQCFIVYSTKHIIQCYFGFYM